MNAVIKAEDTTPASLLMVAVQRGADVDQLGKLMDLQERHDREQARKAFHAAKSAFQAQCPQIIRDREVSYGAGKTQYKYATLAGIASQVREVLNRCGLTYRWEINDTRDSIQVTCILSHIDGHSEHNSMSAAPDDSGAKNDIQMRGSTVTYLQRYTLIGCLGIASANEDDDGAGAGKLNVERLIAHNIMVRNWLDTIVCIKTSIATQEWGTAVEAWHEIPDEDKTTLWLAPTKGGIFTTAEREAMKSNEWNAARKEMFGDIEKSSS